MNEWSKEARKQGGKNFMEIHLMVLKVLQADAEETLQS